MGSEHLLWAARLREDLDNVRAAVGWALERDDTEEQRLALEILAALEMTVRGYPVMWFGSLAIEAAGAAQTAPPELRTPVLTLAAHGEWTLGHLDRALTLARDALRDGLVETTLYPLAGHLDMVVFEMSAGNHVAALEFANSTRPALETIENQYAVCAFLASIANFEAMAGQVEVARADAERALEIARQLQNVEVIASALHGLAWAVQRDDPAAALVAIEEFLDFNRDVGIWSTGVTASGMALGGRSAPGSVTTAARSRSCARRLVSLVTRASARSSPPRSTGRSIHSSEVDGPMSRRRSSAG
jgi:hypothetical protein